MEKKFSFKITKLSETVIASTDPNMFENFFDLNKHLFKKQSLLDGGK